MNVENDPLRAKRKKNQDVPFFLFLNFNCSLPCNHRPLLPPYKKQLPRQSSVPKFLRLIPRSVSPESLVILVVAVVAVAGAAAVTLESSPSIPEESSSSEDDPEEPEDELDESSESLSDRTLSSSSGS
jgi:hypothetical protein